MSVPVVSSSMGRSLPWVLCVAVTSAALAVELYWLAKSRWAKLPHPVARRPELHHHADWPAGPPPRLDSVARAAVIDPDRRAAAGLASLDKVDTEHTRDGA